jgi:cysteine desulfurase/selenocysteine lyase
VVSLVHMSNVLGTINPVAEIAKRAKAAGALVVVDGAQSAPHLPVDVKALGPTSSPSPATRCWGPRGPGSCGAGTRSWRG